MDVRSDRECPTPNMLPQSSEHFASKVALVTFVSQWLSLEMPVRWLIGLIANPMLTGRE